MKEPVCNDRTWNAALNFLSDPVYIRFYSKVARRKYTCREYEMQYAYHLWSMLRFNRLIEQYNFHVKHLSSCNCITFMRIGEEIIQYILCMNFLKKVDMTHIVFQKGSDLCRYYLVHGWREKLLQRRRDSGSYFSKITLLCMTLLIVLIIYSMRK